MQKLDLLDRKIMYELDLDARQPVSRLARKLRRSKETVSFRLRRLVSEGLLKGFYGIFNTSRLGFFYYKFYLKFKNITPAKESELFSYVRGQPRIAYLASMEGNYDAVVLVMVRSPKEIVEFYNPFMQRFGKYVQYKDSTAFLTTHRLNQKFIYSGGERRDWHYPVEIGGFAPDAVDKRILEALTDNARIPVSELAEKAGVDRAVATYRLNKLRKEGIILACVTSPNFEKLGLEFYQINISARNPAKVKAMLEFFDSTDKCLFALEMLGRFDLAVELHLENSGQLRRIMDEFREKFVDDYNDYEIAAITHEYKVSYCPFYW